jgi:hypothetical protein
MGLFIFSCNYLSLCGKICCYFRILMLVCDGWYQSATGADATPNPRVSNAFVTMA